MKLALRRTVTCVLLAPIMFYTLFPFAWLVISSLTSPIELMSKPPHWIPNQLYLDGWEAVLGDPDVMRCLLNSIIIVSFSTVMLIAFGSLGAYAFARLRFPRKGGLLLSILLAQMLPDAIFAVPLFILMSRIGLIDTHLGVILSNLTIFLPYIIWILVPFFESLPQELEDAARVDGCNRLQAMVRIILPISIPGVISAAVFSFIEGWNALFFPLILTRTQSKTLTVALTTYLEHFDVQYVRLCAAGVLGSIPSVLVALIFQKYLRAGLVSGSLKF